MAQISKHIGSTNNLGEVFISHEVLEPDLFFRGKIRNISNSGMSFESDCPFCPKEIIKLKISGILELDLLYF